MRCSTGSPPRSGAAPGRGAGCPALMPTSTPAPCASATRSNESMARTLTMLASLGAAPWADMVRQLEAHLLAGDRWTDRDLVFTQSVGRTMEPSNVHKTFKRHFGAADLPLQRVYDLRHFAAPLLVLQNVPARVVMDILRHSQLGRTMDLYSPMSCRPSVRMRLTSWTRCWPMNLGANWDRAEVMGYKLG